MIFRYLQGSTRVVLARAGVLIAIVALLDWRVDLNISFGFLYLFPLLLVGTVLTRWQILLTALFCTLLADVFDPFPFTLVTGLPQDILVFSSLAGTGLFAYEVTRSRRREAENLRRVEMEVAARREAEEQLEFLIDSSPAAILTMTANGTILLANAAAHRLFAVDGGELPGRNINRYIPALGCVPSIDQTPQTFRTEMQCRGERAHGDVFLANVFFSTYKTASGPRLAALVVDASEELRDREESNLEQLLAGSRILVGAVSHEVRNVCGAIAVIHENLVRSGTLNGNKDFEALGALVETLDKIACLELKQSTSNPELGGVDLAETLDDLRIVLEPYCQEADITVRWDLPAEIPAVLADRHRLLQVLLNLTKNSERALENAETRRIDFKVSVGETLVSIRVTDTGPGIGSAEKLFQPFQKGADSTGLGLYLSRAFVRSFRGDLRHDPTVPGCSFVIDLAVAGRPEADRRRIGKHATHSAVVAR
ncbi:MAG: PAS domain-containing protein [Acidobacteriia bacterium]|nr:PAS domain-containing protein [Terriglobia bacterium]